MIRTKIGNNNKPLTISLEMIILITNVTLKKIIANFKANAKKPLFIDSFIVENKISLFN